MSSATQRGTLSAQAQIIFACITRNLQMQTRRSPLGILSSLVEPIATICIMTIIFSNIKFKIPKLGDYLMLFLMTGVLPISMFRQGLLQPEQSLKRLKRSLVLPQVQPLDLMLAGLLTSLFTMVTLFFGFTIFFYFVYDTPWPQNIVFCMIPAICNAAIGLGICCVNLVIKSWFFYWGTIFAVATGPIGILSGMFYTVERFPPTIQAYLWWNPFMHSTELMRTYYYYEYTSTFFDPIYYYGWTIGALTVGLLCERMFRYRIMQDKQ